MASLFILLTYISTQVSPLLLLCSHILLSGLFFFPCGLPTIASLHISVVMGRALCSSRPPSHLKSCLVWVETPEEKKIRIGPYEPHLLKLG